MLAGMHPALILLDRCPVLAGGDERKNFFVEVQRGADGIDLASTEAPLVEALETLPYAPERIAGGQGNGFRLRAGALGADQGHIHSRGEVAEVLQGPYPVADRHHGGARRQGKVALLRFVERALRAEGAV